MALNQAYRAKIVARLPPEYKLMYEEGGIDDDQLETYASLIGLEPPADFSDVRSEVREDPINGIGGRIVHGLDSAQRSNVEALRAGAQRVAGNVMAAVADSDTVSNLLPIDREAVKERGYELLDESEAGQKRSTAALDELGPGFAREAAEAASDVLGTPSSAASMVGGPTAIIPAIDVFTSEYVAARRAGLDKWEASQMAGQAAAIEFGTEFTPAGKVLGKIFTPIRKKLGGKPGLDQFATDKAKFAGRVGGTAVGEGTTEVFSTLGQEAVSRITEIQGDEGLREYAGAKKSADLWNESWRSFKAGALMGGSISSISTPYELIAERGKLAAQTLQTDTILGDTKRTTAINTQKQVADTNQAFDAVEQEQQLRRSDEEEAAWLTKQAQEYAAANPHNPMAQQLAQIGVTPDMVARERELDNNLNSELRTEFAKLAGQEQQVAREQALAPHLQKAEKDLKDHQVTLLNKAKAKRQAEYRKISAGLLKQAESLPPSEQARFVAEGRMEWEQANPVPTYESMFPKEQPAPEAVVPQAQTQPGFKTDEQGRVTEADVVARPPAPVATQETAAGEPAMTEADIRKAVGLASVQDTPATSQPAVVSWAKEQFGDQVAPNGKPVWQNFVDELGDSKVVDAEGKPLVVYHGTQNADFQQFETPSYFTSGAGEAAMYSTDERSIADRWADRGGAVTDEPFDIAGVEDGISLADRDWWKPGQWYAVEDGVFRKRSDGKTEVSTAGTVAFDYKLAKFVRAPKKPAGMPGTYAAYLSIKNPIHLPWNEANHLAGRGNERGKVNRARMDELIAQGYDGVITESDWSLAKNFIPFFPEQIKSATGNNGNFDKKNPSTLASVNEQQAGTSSSSGKARKMVESITKQIGKSREANVLATMIADGKVVVLDSADQMPGAAKGTQGYYDGEHIYLMADMLDANNLKGSLMVVAAHESKHVADLSQNVDVSASFKNFVGEEANDRIIAKIEAEALAGNPIARKTMERIENAQERGGQLSAEELALEIPAYYVETMLKSQTKSGSLTAAGRDIVSAVRTRYKQLTGNEDVNLKDIGYLAKKLTETIAATSKPITGKTDGIATGLATIAGSKARTLDQARANGITFEDSEGALRWVLEDNESSINIDPAVRGAQTFVARLVNGAKMSLDKILNHEKLFAAYPELSDYNVKLMSPADIQLYGEGNRGLILPKHKLIMINPSLLQDTKRFGQFHSTLLHETQHAVQEIEGVQSGANPEEFYTPDDISLLKEVHRAEKIESKVSQSLISAGGDIVRYRLASVPRDLHAPLARILMKPAMPQTRATELYNFLVDNNLQNLQGLLPVLKDFQVGRNAYVTLYQKGLEAQNRAGEAYRAAKGEKEARFTQYSMRRSLTQMEEEGLTKGFNPEAVWIAEKGLRGDKLLGLASIADDTSDLVHDAVAIMQGRDVKIGTKITGGLFNAFGVLGRPLGNQLELSESHASSIALRAKSHFHQLEYGIEQKAIATRTEGESLQDAKARVQADITGLLEEISGYDTIDRREAALARYVANNPELKPLLAALNDINEQSMNIVRARAADPAPMTDKEIAKYGAILQNRFTYLNRTYAAFQGEAGRNWAKALVREAALAKAQVAKGKGVSKKYRQSFETYNRAIQHLIENEVYVTDPSKLLAKKMESIENLYHMWVGNPERLKRELELSGRFNNTDDLHKHRKDQMIAEVIAQMEKAKPYQIEKRARDIVMGALGLEDNTNPIARYYRGLKEDRSILEKRETVPPEIRALFGEITDWPTRVAVTLGKQGELVARMNLLQWIKDNRMAVSEQEKFDNPDFSEFTEGLTGEAWGPLDGMFTKPELAIAIKDGIEAYTTLGEAVASASRDSEKLLQKAWEGTKKAVTTTASLQKFSQIVVSPFAMFANAVGSLLILVQHGVTNVDHMNRAATAALELITNQLAPSGITIGDKRYGAQNVSADLELFVKWGMLDSAIAQELRRSPSHYLRELIKQKQGVTAYQEYGNMIRKIRDRGGELGQAWVETFAMSDAWVRPAVFLSRAEFLAKINRIENKGWTQDEIYQQASDYAKDTTITFLRAAPIIKGAERVGLTTFGPYFQTVFRSLGYTMVNGIKDLHSAVTATSPEARLTYAIEGARKIVGTGLATSGAVVAMRAFANFVNDDEDEDVLEAAKKLLFPEGRFGEGIYMGKNKNGEPMFFRFGRFDPNGPMTDLIRIATSDKLSAEEKSEFIIDSVKDLWIKNRGVTNLLQLTLDVFADTKFKNKDTKLERMPWLDGVVDWTKTIMNTGTGLPDSSDAETLIQFADSFTPGWANVFDPTNKRPEEAAGNNAEIGGLLLWITGGRFDVANAGLASYTAAKELNDLRTTARADIADSQATRGDMAALAQVQKFLAAEQKAFNRVQEVYEGMVGMGMSPAKAQAALKDAGLDATDMALVRQGRRTATVAEWGTKYSRLLSEKSLVGHARNRNRDLTEAEEKEAKKESQEAAKRLILLNKEGR